MGFLDKVKDAASEAAEKVSDAADKAKEGGGGLGDKIADAAKDAKEGAEKAAKKAKSTAKEAPGRAKGKAKGKKDAPGQKKKAQAKEASSAPEYETYTVKSGDTLSAIGEKYGVPYMDIAKLNNIENPDLIHPGQEFKIPKS